MKSFVLKGKISEIIETLRILRNPQLYAIFRRK